MAPLETLVHTKGRQAVAKKVLSLFSAARISADAALAVMVDAGLKPHYVERLLEERQRQRRLAMDRRNEATKLRRQTTKGGVDMFEAWGAIALLTYMSLNIAALAEPLDPDGDDFNYFTLSAQLAAVVLSICWPIYWPAVFIGAYLERHKP